MKTFNFHIEADHNLTVDQIWPDGDAPPNPTIQDVLALVADLYPHPWDGATLMRDWELDADLFIEGHEFTAVLNQLAERTPE